MFFYHDIRVYENGAAKVRRLFGTSGRLALWLGPGDSPRYFGLDQAVEAAPGANPVVERITLLRGLRRFSEQKSLKNLLAARRTFNYTP